MSTNPPARKGREQELPYGRQQTKRLLNCFGCFI